MSDAQQTDLVVIGLGPGGEALATAAAKAGLAVVAVDRRLVGGECPYFGCVPTKMMVRGSEVLGEAARVAELAGEVTVTPSWEFEPVMVSATVLRLRGAFPLRPSAIQFDLLFTWDRGWRLEGLAVQAVQPAR